MLAAVFCAFPLVSSAEELLAPRSMALDVIEWARHGSPKFNHAHVDRALLTKKTKIVLYGEVFEELEKEGRLPKGYVVIRGDEILKVDWKTTGLISIGRAFPEGGFEASVSTGPLSMIGYRIVPVKDGYKVYSNGGS